LAYRLLNDLGMAEPLCGAPRRLGAWTHWLERLIMLIVVIALAGFPDRRGAGPCGPGGSDSSGVTADV
jgi:hypothetical protein